MNHKELIEHLKKLKDQSLNNELAQLLLLKKAENFLRDLIVMEIDKSSIKEGLYYRTAVRETNKHDIAIMEGIINKKGNYVFNVNTIIEMNIPPLHGF
ncbi:hypothetical protein [Neobacillus cucumis]|uniref:hypothetical protein n=1 Tax=Neobacillus cucumis TaxID=1740721 RepID=UPI002E1CBC4D|nr:hypothetical protein [Neobacillus cucumis]